MLQFEQQNQETVYTAGGACRLSSKIERISIFFRRRRRRLSSFRFPPPASFLPPEAIGGLGTAIDLASV